MSEIRRYFEVGYGHVLIGSRPAHVLRGSVRGLAGPAEVF